MGVSGCGKTTVGKTLAARLQTQFVEADDYHPARNKRLMAAGTALTDSDRWPWLDALGQAIGATWRQQGAVVASCSALKRSYRERLAQAAAVPPVFILLTASRDALEQRLQHRQGHYMPASLLDSQLATLEMPGADEQVHIVDCEGPLHTAVAQALEHVTGLQQQVTRKPEQDAG